MSKTTKPSALAPIRLMGRAIQIVLFVCAAFGGFLLNVSPPDYSNDLPLKNGLVQFGALVILLAASAAIRSFLIKGQRVTSLKAVKIWFFITLTFGIGFIIMGVLYYNDLTDYTLYNAKWEKRFIRGTEFTSTSNEICTEENKKGFEDCEYYLFTDYYTSDQIAFGNLLWKEVVVNSRKKTLFRDYIAMILCLCTALFSLVEYLSLRFPAIWQTAESSKKQGEA